ncbi:hypothetical protein EON65_49170 [archaeon]|nr:MAG: hypothetical protein EON65_49170 [archaeon]
MTYIFIRRSGLIIACTTRYNVSPSATVELLVRMAKVFKDYCGLLTEEAIRKNFVLVYELLEEMMVSLYACYKFVILLFAICSLVCGFSKNYTYPCPPLPSPPF